ncbi:MAG: 5-formyltetrahydrofolate cyclo-ligase [Proteobacteria bacterium]|nr:5-formyltetrahydrofolate cyclo-ligase [Pseudomonadota bacterium]MCK4868672.1 5-formyltetrahydrofolate cyclo-ligase [Alphaproteobacteria bacterium]
MIIANDIDIDETKSALRREATARRRELVAPDDATRLLIDNLLGAGAIPAGATVSGFWPIGGEIDLLPVLRALAARGHEIALPVVVGKARPLVFRAWRDGDEMSEGPWGIREPLESAPEIAPRVLLVPLLAFDRAGYRLGYGGGFYDRSLEGLRARGAVTAIGAAWAGQEVSAVPHGAHDQPLDWMLTERECFHILGERS